MRNKRKNDLLAALLVLTSFLLVTLIVSASDDGDIPEYDVTVQVESDVVELDASVEGAVTVSDDIGDSIAIQATGVNAEPDLMLPPDMPIEIYEEAEAEWVTLQQLNAANNNDEPLECTGSTPNLLANPSFEGAYSDYVPNPPIDDCEWGVCFSAQMAAGWTPYWQSHNDATDEGWEFLMPEYKPATSNFTNPTRVRSGDRAQQLFTFWATHRAGIYQQVYNVEPGQNYCLSVWGHAWSGATDDPYTDLSDHGFLNQKIGIDPYGGKDFNSGNIVWTPATTQYDEYGLFKMEVTAQSDTLTVFFNSQPLWAKKHNDVYWDDAILVRSGAVEPPAMTVSPTWMAFTAETAQPVQSSAEVTINIENNADNLWYTANVLPQSDFTPNVNILGPNMTVYVDSTGLPAGTHRATIEVVASDDTIEGGRQYVTVQIDVAQSDPIVRVMGKNYGFMMDDEETGSDSGQVIVHLENTESLPNPAWSAVVDPSRSDFMPTLDASWGRDGDPVQFTIDATGFETGVYTAWVDVRGNDPSFANVGGFAITIVVAEEIYRTHLPIISR